MRRLSRISVAVLAILFFAATVNAATIDVALNADDAASNSASLQAAITRAAVGDSVRIAAGTFSIANSVRLKSGVDLVGISTAKSILTASFNRLQPMVTGSGISRVGLHGFTLDGHGDASVTQGIQLEKSEALIIHDLTIMNLPGSDRADAPLGPHAIDCTSAVSKSTFDSITCKSIGIGRTWGGGIRLSWKSSGNLVTHCVIADTGRGGIFCNDGSTDNVISANVVTGSGGVGLGIEVQNCDRSLIEQNSIDHWLSVDNSSTSAVRGNQINAADNTYKLCGIEIVDSHDVVVSNNSVTGGAKVNLSISGPKPKTRMLFSNNLFESATTWGTQIEGDAGGATQLYFASNRFIKTRTGPSPLYANQGHGVRLNGNCSAIVFDENEIAHNAGVGIQLTGENVSQLGFYGNSILDNESGAIDGDAIPHLSWIGNRVLPANGAKLWEQASDSIKATAGTVQLSAKSVAVGDAIAASANFPNGFHPTVWLWDLGRGLPVTTAAVNYAYDQAGTFRVTAIGWDSSGHAGRATSTVSVTAASTTDSRH